MNKILLTCEHAGNKVPEIFPGKIPSKVLETHRGVDIGALAIAKFIAKKNDFPLIFHEETRLVMDYNRSLHNFRIWSEYSKGIPVEIKNELISQYKRYRKKIFSKIDEGYNLHFAIHSFTPVLNGEVRNCDISFLFDSRMKRERKLAEKLKVNLETQGYSVRFNYPYLGKSDGLSSQLRRAFGKNYLGFEIEVNQAIVHEPRVKKDLAQLLSNL